MTGGASRTARLQYLSAPEPSGHQPRNRHEVNDPLLLALQKELTSDLLWVLVFLLLPKQSAQWAPKRMGGCLPGQTTTGRSRRKDKYNASSGKENEGQTTVREPRGKLVDVLDDDQPRASSCRDNLPKPVVPRRQGTYRCVTIFWQNEIIPSSAPRLQTYCDAATSFREKDTPAATGRDT